MPRRCEKCSKLLPGTGKRGAPFRLCAKCREEAVAKKKKPAKTYCTQCGKAFKVEPGPGRASTYCSQRCQLRGWGRITKPASSPCTGCGKIIRSKPGPGAPRTFCVKCRP